jgi:hypothetical protein
MAEKHSLLKRILTLSTPFYLVWAMLACVSVCASHLEGLCAEETPHHSAASLVSPDTDCCPMIRAIGSNPERLSVYPGSSLDSNSFLLPIGRIAIRINHIPHFAATHSPPFERLCILRI